MPYKIAGIDVHKRMLHVVVSDVQVDGEYDFTRRIFGSLPVALRSLAAWLLEQQVQEVVMESTAQYWKPVWGALERYWKPICQIREGALATSGRLHLAQAQSNRGRRGRKKDFRDAERLVKRLVAHELVLSFVPDVEQRLWRTVVRTKYQLTRNRVQLQNRLEALLEEAHIKLSSLVSDLLGASARRMLAAIADGETNRETLAALADRALRATQEQLQDALGVCQALNPVYRRLIKMVLDEVASIDKRIEQLNQEVANLLRPHEDQVKRLAEVPGLGVDSAQQVIAEVGATAATFPSEKHLSSWVGACPGDEESAEVNRSRRSPARQPSDAANSESSCQCGGQIQGKHLSNSLSPLRAAYGTQSNHRNNCPQTLSLDLEDIAPGNPLRGTRPRGQESVQAKAHPKNDPRTPQAWLPNRTEPFSISHHSMIAISDWHGFRPCVP